MIRRQCGDSSSALVGWEKGKKEYQEDYYGVYSKDNRVLFAAADGIGGHSWGHLASRWMVEELVKAFLENTNAAEMFRCGVEKAVSRMEAYEKDMGCTFTASIIEQVQAKFKLSYSWIGDSRLYLLSSNINNKMPPGAKEITRMKNRIFWLLTEDDSFVWGFLQKGELTLDQITQHPDKSYLERSVHPGQKNLSVLAERRAKTIDIDKHDTIFLCTDGIWETYSRQSEIMAHLNDKEPIAKFRRHLQKSKQEGVFEDDGTFIYAKAREDIFKARCFPREQDSDNKYPVDPGF